jgi:hypothetical protein
MKMKVDVRGIEETKKRLQKSAKQIESNSRNTVEEVAILGFNFAHNLAPEFTGSLKSAMMFFPQNKEAWVIQSGPAPNDNGYPVNVLFDQGTYPDPRRQSSLFFMKQTAEFLEKEFAERLNLSIQRAIK